MAWIEENLSGVKNGSNVNFTISAVPIPETLLVFWQGIPLEKVGSQPGNMGFAYSIGGTSITVGGPPLAGQSLWARYYTA